jgi:hypothetical protein
LRIQYDVYCYIGKNITMQVLTEGGAVQVYGSGTDGGQKADNRYKDMHYMVYHDDAVEEISVDYALAEGGWYNLGRYYYSKDTAKVVLTNKSKDKIVIGDAIRWVMHN